MKYNKIGVIGALEGEIRVTIANMTNVVTATVGAVEFYSGTYNGIDVVICCSGMGKAASAAATQLLCSHFSCNAVIFSGIAGNMSGKVGINDVVLGQSVFYHDSEIDMLAQSYPNLKSYTADESLISAADKACGELGVTHILGSIATGDLFVGSDSLKADIRSRCNPDCVEMEGASVSHIAAKNDVPCLIIRSISDNADDVAGVEVAGNDEFDISEFCETASSILLKTIAIVNDVG